jgi:predicted nucleic acid-binding protein
MQISLKAQNPRRNLKQCGRSGTKNLKNEPSKNRILLDTHPLIKLFTKEPGWEAVQKIIECAENGTVEAAISVVTLTEIYYRYIHQKRADLGKTRVDELKLATYLHKLDIDERIAVMAGELKGKYSIPVSDALIAATAYFEKSTVITDDADFKRLTEIETLTGKEFFQ